MATFDSNRFWWFEFDLHELMNHPAGPAWTNIRGNTTRMGVLANRPRMWKIRLKSDQRFGNGGQATINDQIIPDQPLHNNQIPQFVTGYLTEHIEPELKAIGLTLDDFEVTVTCWSAK